MWPESSPHGSAPDDHSLDICSVSSLSSVCLACVSLRACDVWSCVRNTVVVEVVVVCVIFLNVLRMENPLFIFYVYAILVPLALDSTLGKCVWPTARIDRF